MLADGGRGAIVHTMRITRCMVDPEEAMNVAEAFARMQHCRDLATFYRRWAATEAAGLPMGEALPGLREGSADIVKERIERVMVALDHGDFDVQAGSGGFTEVEIAFINVGMTTGSLDSALGSLADLYQTDYRAVLRARRKAVYPLMVAFCACWIPTFPIAFFVGPALWITVGVVLTAAVFALGGVAIWRYFVWMRAKPRWAQVRFFWALSTALEVGVHLDEALALSARATAPSHLSDGLRYLVPQGRPVAELLRTSGIFDAAALNLIESGEVAGKLPGALRQAARYLESGVL